MSLLWFDTCLDILLLRWWVILIFCLVIHFCVMQHQQQHHPPSGTEINAAPASDKWRTGSETKSHRQRKTFVCACSMISPLSYFTNPLRDIWRDPLFRMELGDTTDVSSISARCIFQHFEDDRWSVTLLIKTPPAFLPSCFWASKFWALRKLGF